MMSIVPDDATRRPPLLEQVIRFLVWFFVLGCIATPVIVLTLVHGKVFGSLWGGNRDLPQPMLQINLGNAAPAKPKIATGVLGEERSKQIARLKSLSGRPEQASGSATSLQIVAVAFEGVKPGIAETPATKRQSVDDDGYRRLSLDLGQAPNDAVLIIADQPIRWRLEGLTQGSWPHVGFEGYAAFDVLNGQPGTLAGFRIGSFGATDIARAVDPTEGEVSNRTTFCAAAQKWADHFGLPFSAVRFALVRNPSQISIRSRKPVSDGNITNSMDANELDRLCKQRAAR
jgi:hypothetical protein